MCSEGRCEVPRCGDGVLNSADTCDDGNTVTEECDYGVEACTVCAADCTEQAVIHPFVVMAPWMTEAVMTAILSRKNASTG